MWVPWVSAGPGARCPVPSGYLPGPVPGVVVGFGAGDCAPILQTAQRYRSEAAYSTPLAATGVP